MFVKRLLKPEERLIVAADFSAANFSNGVQGVERMILDLADQLRGTGVVLKVNSALRALGYGLIPEIQRLGLEVFADLKLVDIPNTMRTDAEMLVDTPPDILTVMGCAGINGMRAVQGILGGKTEVLGVTILTSFDEDDCQNTFVCSTKAGVLRFARMAQLAELSGLVLSPKEIAVVRDRPELKLSLTTPGIRPAWAIVEGDDQSRVTTPQRAIEFGADRIVMGRPIVKAAPNDQGLPQSPKEAVERTLEEIRAALAAREGQQ